MNVTIRTRAEGCRFATVGEVVALNHRVVATTEPVPYGFTDAALDAARRIIVQREWTEVARG